MQKSLLIFRISLLTALWVLSKMSDVDAQTMARANQQTPAEQSAKARPRSATIDLRQLLNQLEKTYQVQFNYKASLVSGVAVSYTHLTLPTKRIV